jgi:ring-opening amidohydrolase-like protein
MPCQAYGVPPLTPAGIDDADRRGATVVTRDPNGSKGLARGAMALGVAVALGELSKEAAVAALSSKDMSKFSKVAATSACGELKHCEVIVFGNSADSRSDFRIGHATLKDVIDADGSAWNPLGYIRARGPESKAPFASPRCLPRPRPVQRDASGDGAIRCFPMRTSTTNGTRAR